jgi:xanthine dehydrogenase accessory factor
MKELLTLLCHYLNEGRPVALASVVARQGSTPRGVGSRLVADKDGLVAGTVGGGALESQTLEACRAALQNGEARMLALALSGQLAAQDGMICGGSLRVLVEPLLSRTEDLRFFQAIRDALGVEDAVWITDITDLSHPLHTARINGVCIGAPLPEDTIAKLLGAALPARQAGIQTQGDRTYFIEHCLPPPRMIIAGGGHVSRPTAQVAAIAGFEVAVLDDRPEFSQPERFPWATRVITAPDYADCFADCAPNSNSFIVIVTRGHVHDTAVLSQALATRAGYIGMIGSRRKRAEVYDALRAQGTSEQDLARVHCPVGLAIGAETPKEIAVSIVAECIAHQRKGRLPEGMPC